MGLSKHTQKYTFLNKTTSKLGITLLGYNYEVNVSNNVMNSLYLYENITPKVNLNPQKIYRLLTVCCLLSYTLRQPTIVKQTVVLEVTNYSIKM